MPRSSRTAGQPKQVATTRRTGLVQTYGVGALLPSQDDSFMIRGLDRWPPGDEIVETRLSNSLGVNTFRLPSAGRRAGDVPAVRFPVWVFCPKCRVLGPHFEVCRRGSRQCGKCGSGAVVSPSRFVACCPKGHIEDFPYRAWAHERADIGHEGHSLKLIARGHTSALSDLIVQCECGVSRSMADAFKRGAFRGMKRCSGGRPWLDSDEIGCEEELRTLQRGSSNVWFAQTRSAISIPSAKNRADDYVRSHMANIAPGVDTSAVVGMFGQFPDGLTADDVKRALDRMLNPAAGEEPVGEEQLRAEEYAALCHGSQDPTFERLFQCVEEDITDSKVRELFDQVSRVSRLREVRALTGFSRIVPAVGDDVAICPISNTKRPDWLPAIEVLGEGVFVTLNQEKLDRWASSEFAQSRVALLERSLAEVGEYSLARNLDLSARSLALHTLAHILIDEMALSCGYPAASLRERLYDQEGQAGILIYTATADSPGSLGGLAALSDPERFEQTLASAVRRARWCTSDPVCIESTGSGVDGLNLAACHACVLLPETSCERFNLMLDRACLIGTPEQRFVGLFGKEYDI